MNYKAKKQPHNSNGVDYLNRKLFKLKIITYVLVLFFGLASVALAIVLAVTRNTISGLTFNVVISLLVVCQVLCLASLAIGYTIQSKWMKEAFESKVGK